MPIQLRRYSSLLALSLTTAALGDQSNIVFFILDDVGIDQLRPFNSISPTIDPSPVIESLCNQGIKFTNTWVMPSCSPSRACFFTGRDPLRTNVINISTPTTPPHSQTSPYEVTVAEALLQGAGYSSTYCGKLHLGDPTLNPGGNGYPFDLGFEWYYGTPYGGPAYLDPTIGSQIEESSAYDSTGLPYYSCGFPVDAKTSLPVECSCGWLDESGEPAWQDGVNALDCLAAGGVPLVNADNTPVTRGSAAAVERINWGNYNTDGNGYYWMPVVDIQGKYTDAVTYKGQYVTHRDGDKAVEYIQAQQASGKPWMCTLGFINSHDPYQPPPRAQWPTGSAWPDGLPMVCSPQSGVPASGTPNPTSQSEREMMQLMNRAADYQIGRVLVHAGLAAWNSDGGVTLTDPNTTVVIIGDNGTYYPVVRAPYNPLESKGTVYQTGVCVPLVVAGAQVNAPGRSVDHMVNGVDLFQLFAELAGVDVNSVVPSSHQLDCQSMIGYLKSPDAPAVRTLNFTQTGLTWMLTDNTVYPCFMADLCMCTDDIFFSQNLCEANGGEWMDGVDSCCEVAADNPACGNPPAPATVYPTSEAATFDGRYKLVRLEMPKCNPDGSSSGESEFLLEFYDLSTAPFHNVLPGGRGIDYPMANLLATEDGTTCDCSCLEGDQPLAHAACVSLLAQLLNLLNQGQFCPGDGNQDRVVNGEDLANIFVWWGDWPTVYDFNNDGVTNGEDLAAILSNWGECPG